MKTKIMLWVFVTLLLSSLASAFIYSPDAYYQCDTTDVALDTSGNNTDMHGVQNIIYNNSDYKLGGGSCDFISTTGYMYNETTAFDVGLIHTFQSWVVPETVTDNWFVMRAQGSWTGSDNSIYFGLNSAGQAYATARSGDAEQFTVTGTSDLRGGAFSMITLVTGSGGVQLYVNETSEDTDASTFSGAGAGWDNIAMGHPSYSYNGLADNTAYFTEEFTQQNVIDSFNGGLGVNFVSSGDLTVSALYPVSESYINTQNVNFLINNTASFSEIDTCGVYTNSSGAWSLNASNSSALSNTTTSFYLGLYEGNFSYGGWCNDTLGNEAVSTNQSFIIDTTNPTITENINGHYTDTINYLINSSDQYLNNLSIIDTCGLNFLNASIPLSNTEFSQAVSNLSLCSLGTQQTNITACDNAGNCALSSNSWENRARINISFYDLINSSQIQSFDIYINGSLVGSTSNYFFSLDNKTVGESFLIVPTNTQYQDVSQILTVSSAYEIVNISAYRTNSVNFSFFYEHNQSLIVQALTVALVGDYASHNYTTSNGSLYIDLVYPSEYTIIYGATPFGRERQYIFELTNRSHYDLALFLLNSSLSSDLTITTYDQSKLTVLENSIIYLQRYYINENQFKTVAMYSTDIGGKAYFDVEQQQEYYKILVDSPLGTRRLTTGKFYIEAAAINLYVSLSNVVGEQFYDEQSISYSIGYSNTSREFSASFSDVEGVASRFCFNIKEYSRFSKTVLNSSCSSDSSGTFVLSHPATEGTYYGLLTATIDGEETIIASAWGDYITTSQLSSGQFGIFMTIVIIMIMAFLSQLGILALILGSAGLIFSKLLGLINIGWGYVGIIFMAAVILAIIIEMMKK